MRRNTKIVGGILLVAIVLVTVGYAAITNIDLKINGTAKSEASQANFVVELIEEPITSGKGTTIATINSDRTTGKITVTELNAKGDTATAIYKVKNKSKDLSADLSAKATSSNEDYFEVICKLDETTLKPDEETIMTVTVKLLKTPIDETKENVRADIGVNIYAEPKQQGEEVNGGSTTVTSSTKTTAGTYLPDGFVQVQGTTLDNGLTIQDSTGNQYVWVEVPKTDEVYPTAGLNITEFTTDEYTAIETDLHTYTNDYRNGTSYKDEYYSDAVTGLTSEQYTVLKQKMLQSVYKNGGFYVGKYETGIEDAPKTSGSSTTAPTEKPVIKQNAYPYNYVTCSQAQTLASNMESGNYTSSLMFGVQWDLVLTYLEKKGTAQADLKTNSTTWGNYSNNLWNITNANSKYYSNSKWTSGAYGTKASSTGILLSTGASDTFSKQGIYDLAGNVWEWILEYTSNTSSPCAYRGGYYSNNGSSTPAIYRYYSTTSGCNDIFGFRVSLF